MDLAATATLPSADDLESLDAVSLAEVLAQVDRVRRQAEVLLAEGVALAERRGHFRADGHRSVGGWCRGSFDWSPSEATRVCRNGRVLAVMPLLREAARSGGVGIDQLTAFGRVHANPRCADQLPESDELLTGIATRHWFPEFRVALARWEALADFDGALREHRDAHEQRTAVVSVVGSQLVVHAEGGVADGVLMREVFDRFCDAEFLTDWAEARERLGEAASSADLARTDSQRRFDALQAIFLAATTAPAVVQHPEPLVNVLLDRRTAEELLARAAGDDVPSPDPREFVTRRCETVDGVQLHPSAALAALLNGRLRRVVVDSASVVIDLGRTSRLFRGGARDAAILGELRCLWAGCSVRTRRCQTDHTIEWATGEGSTSPSNGGPACGHHNRWKSRGYSTRRDEHGVWHTYRPDGSEVGGRPAAA